MKQGQKKKPIMLILLIGIPVLAAAVVGVLIGIGMIKLPGAKKKPEVVASKNYTESPDPVMKKEDIKTVIDPPAAPLVAKKPIVKVDPVQVDLDKGAKQLAKVWANMDADKLKPIAESYKVPELARVLVKLPPEKSAELLSELDADLATKVSREIEKISSLVPAAPPG